MRWDAKEIDAGYRTAAPSFLEGAELAIKQGIPEFIEEYRMSKVKEAIAPLIIETAGNENSRILDAGCGNGWYPLSLAASSDFRGRVVCVDISPHNVELLNNQIAVRGLTERISAQVTDCENLPFEDAAFDLIYSTESVEHMETPVVFFSEAFRTLKPSGRLMVTTPSRLSHDFWKMAATLLSAVRGTPTKQKASFPSIIYERTLSKRKLLGAMKRAGFEIREYRKSVFLPHESCFQFLPIWISRLLLAQAKLLERLVPLTALCALHQIVTAEKTPDSPRAKHERENAPRRH